MAKFTFKGKADKFNPNCTSTLLFDNKDESTERIFCTETTCVDSVYTPSGVTTSCRTQMLPAGHTDEKFIWGVEGGPWISNVSYSGFEPSPNEFVEAGARFIKVQKPADPSGCGWKYIAGITNRWLLNQDHFSSSWDIQDTANAGYAAMAGGDLNGIEVNPAAAIEPKFFEPNFYAPYGCYVSNGAYEIPKITYYDVGSRLIPDEHIVEFPDALIQLNFSRRLNLSEPSLSGFFDDTAYFNTYVKPALAGPNCGMAYSSGNHPDPNPAIIDAFTFDGTGSTSKRLNARFYYPTKDNDALPGNTVKRGVQTGVDITTGYRMQKYVQIKHEAIFGTFESRISSGLRHIETRMYPLGYSARWEFINVVPKTVYATIYTAGSQYPWQVYSFQAKASVFIRVYYIPFNYDVYEYGPFRKDVPTGIQPGQLSPYNPPVAYSEANTYKGDILNPPWLGWKWERSLNPFNYDPRYNPPPAIVLGSHWLITGDSGGWRALPTHTFGFLPSDINDLRNPKKLKTLLYYINKLNRVTANDAFNYWMSQYAQCVVDPSYISYGGQSFTRLGNTYLPPATNGKAIRKSSIPETPDDFKIFRKKVSDTSINTVNSQPIKLSYSAKREWFNGTCPFELNFDRNQSSKVFIKNQCETTIKPYIEPSGE